MNVTKLEIVGALLIEPKVHGDDRGYFLETFSAQRYRDAGVDVNFVQDNLSKSQRGVLRGLHFQNPNQQGKLVSCPLGEVFDVIVDIRKNSPSFGQWFGVLLSEKNKKQLWVPAGTAHGFLVTSETALFSYKCSDYYSPKDEYSLLWNDSEIGVAWPEGIDIQLSAKDQKGRRLVEFSDKELPRFQT